MSSNPRVTTLVLDTGPLLSMAPLHGLAAQFVTVPQILEELKDRKARGHLGKLSLIAGIEVEVRNPDAAALAKVIAAAKKTGDYSVLSKADLYVLALTHALDEEWKAKERQRKDDEPHDRTPESVEPFSEEVQLASEQLNELSLENDTQPLSDRNLAQAVEAHVSTESENDVAPLFEDPPSEDDDGEGEWITPDNVALHKSRELELLPSEAVASGSNNGKDKAPIPQQHVSVGCMTADFAMQNVLLYMGLHLIGVGGKQITQLKTWVLRCHACFKICKNPSKNFCPSCGNPTLLRTSATVSAPAIPGSEPTIQIHLKKNFQYRNRGTKYSIPSPKPGSSKSGTGEGLILREDQTEWLRAEKHAENRRLREEKKLLNAVSTSTGTGIKLDWMDPDWLPEMLTVGAGGKGRSTGKDDMPTIGYGRRNPNERRRRK